MSEIKSYPAPSKIRYRLERVLLRRWFKRFTNFLTIIAIIFIASYFLFILLSEYFKLKNLESFLNTHVFERPELSVSSVEIKNANSDLVNQINAILKLSFPISSMKIDINSLQEIINSIDSVETSSIRITDNGVLIVEVIERIPVAVFRENSQLALIDIKGYKISNIFSRSDRKDLPLIAGFKGNLQAREALEIYKILFPNLHKIQGLIRIGQRRWDIIFKNNTRIKLPEKNPKNSLKKFLNSDLKKFISSKDFMIIDLRFTNKTILRRINKKINK